MPCNCICLFFFVASLNVYIGVRAQCPSTVITFAENLGTAATFVEGKCGGSFSGAPIEVIRNGCISNGFLGVPQNLYNDGCDSTSTRCINCDRFGVEYDLQNVYRVTAVTVYGDADGSHRCDSFVVCVYSSSRVQVGCTSSANCNANMWHVVNPNLEGQVVRVFVEATSSNGVQVDQIWIKGFLVTNAPTSSPTETPTSSPSFSPSNSPSLSLTNEPTKSPLSSPSSSRSSSPSSSPSSPSSSSQDEDDLDGNDGMREEKGEETVGFDATVISVMIGVGCLLVMGIMLCVFFGLLFVKKERRKKKRGGVREYFSSSKSSTSLSSTKSGDRKHRRSRSVQHGGNKSPRGRKGELSPRHNKDAASSVSLSPNSGNVYGKVDVDASEANKVSVNREYDDIGLGFEEGGENEENTNVYEETTAALYDEYDENYAQTGDGLEL